MALAAVLLCAAAGAASAGLHAADLRRGPLPGLARHQAVATVDVELTGDPRVRRPHLRGAVRGPDVVEFTADARTVWSPRDGTATRVRTPVLVLVRPAKRLTGNGLADRRAPAARPDGWTTLLPSTRLRLRAAAEPPLPGARETAAVLRVTAGGPPHVIGPPVLVQRLAGRVREGLRQATAPLDDDARGLLPGLVVGDTSRLPPDLEEAFRATDLTHLLAVSGSNLSILLALLIGPTHLARRTERRGLAPRLGLPLRGTALVGAALVGAFVVVCRPEPSVLRAAACGLLTLVALATGRRRAQVPALAAAVLFLVLLAPWLARTYGFALSVLATGALLLLAPGWAEALRRRGVPARLAEGLAAAAAVQVVCAPVLVVLAGRVSLLAVPCNLVAEVAVVPATVLGFACLATATWAPAVAHALAWCAAWPTDWLARVARTGADLPGAGFAWPGGALGGLLLVPVALTVVAAGRAVLRRGRTYALLLVLLLLVLVVVRPLPLSRLLAGWPPPQWRLVACDVGQGDGLVLWTAPGSAVVVDTGPEPQAIDACLRDLGVRRVPLLVLTHFHADHVDGLPGALRGRSVGAIETTGVETPPGQAAFVRREAARAHVPVVRAVTGERRHVGPLSWQVLWPEPVPDGAPAPVPPPLPTPPPGPAVGQTGAATGALTEQGDRDEGYGGDGDEGNGGDEDVNPNDTSVVMLVRTGDLTAALLGDLEPASQERLLEDHPDLPHVDVVKVAHHGSAHQYQPLMDRLSPRLALISCGMGNPYGHPAPVTVAALRLRGTEVLRTDTSGTIAVSGSHAHLATTVRGGDHNGEVGPAPHRHRFTARRVAPRRGTRPRSAPSRPATPRPLQPHESGRFAARDTRRRTRRGGARHPGSPSPGPPRRGPPPGRPGALTSPARAPPIAAPPRSGGEHRGKTGRPKAAGQEPRPQAPCGAGPHAVCRGRGRTPWGRGPDATEPSRTP